MVPSINITVFLLALFLLLQTLLPVSAESIDHFNSQINQINLKIAHLGIHSIKHSSSYLLFSIDELFVCRIGSWTNQSKANRKGFVSSRLWTPNESNVWQNSESALYYLFNQGLSILPDLILLFSLIDSEHVLILPPKLIIIEAKVWSFSHYN